MNAQAPQLDLTLLLPPDLAHAVDAADRAARERIDAFADASSAVASAKEESPIFHHDVRALATLTRIRKTVADFLLRHPELLPDPPDDLSRHSPKAKPDPGPTSSEPSSAAPPNDSESSGSPSNDPSSPEPPAECKQGTDKRSSESLIAPQGRRPGRVQADAAPGQIGRREARPVCFPRKKRPVDGFSPASTNSQCGFPKPRRTFDLPSASSSHPVNPVDAHPVDAPSPWRPVPPPRREKPRPAWKKRTRPSVLPLLRGDAPPPDPTMAGIIAGELDVLPDGSVVPYLDPAARAPIARVHELLSPRLERDLARATRDLADAMPRHLTSASLKTPRAFARDVHRLGQVVSLHATLAEAALAKHDLAKNLSQSPLAKTDPWTALALTLPHPPADRLDDLFAWLESPETPEATPTPSSSLAEISNLQSEIPSPAPFSCPSHPSCPSPAASSSHASPSSDASASPAIALREGGPSSFTNSLAVVENLSSSPHPSHPSPSSHPVNLVNPVDTSAPPFDAALCLRRIGETVAALGALDPRHPVRTGLRLTYSKLCHPEPSPSPSHPLNRPSPPEPPAECKRGMDERSSESLIAPQGRRPGRVQAEAAPGHSGRREARPLCFPRFLKPRRMLDLPSASSSHPVNLVNPVDSPSAQPSLAVFPGLSLNPAWLPYGLARVTLNRLLPEKPLHPVALGRQLRAAAVETAVDFIDPLLAGLRRAPWAFRRAHAPP